MKNIPIPVKEVECHKRLLVIEETKRKTKQLKKRKQNRTKVKEVKGRTYMQHFTNQTTNKVKIVSSSFAHWPLTLHVCVFFPSFFRTC